MSSEIIYITLSSADSSNPGVGTAAGNAVFSNSFETPIDFEPGDYEVALFALSVHTDPAFNPANFGSTYIYSNFVDASVVVGSSKTNLLRRVYIDTVNARIDHHPNLLQFVPMAGNSFSNGSIELRSGPGVALPVPATQGTTVTLAIRRKHFSLL